MSEERLLASRRRPRLIRLHGFVSKPWRKFRRRLLDRLSGGKVGGERGRIHAPSGNDRGAD